MLQGITAGFILSLALFPGTVWLAKIGRSGTPMQVFIVALAFAISQFFWICISAPGLMMMTKHLSFLHAGMYWFAAFVLVYMGVKIFRSPKVTQLDHQTIIGETAMHLFRANITRAIAMPMRLPAAVAIIMATGVFVSREPTPNLVYSIIIGGVIGVTWWWGQFAFLSAFFAKKVPVRITLRSLNRIRTFCGLLFFLLALICAALSSGK